MAKITRIKKPAPAEGRHCVLYNPARSRHEIGAAWDTKGSKAGHAKQFHAFNARGKCWVYGRRDEFGDLTVQMDVWRAADGRLLVRFRACHKDGHKCYLEVTGFPGPRGWQKGLAESQGERWVPQCVREMYDQWIARPCVCPNCSEHEEWGCDCMEYAPDLDCAYCWNTFICPYHEVSYGSAPSGKTVHCSACGGAYIKCGECSGWYKEQDWDENNEMCYECLGGHFFCDSCDRWVPEDEWDEDELTCKECFQPITANDLGINKNDTVTFKGKECKVIKINGDGTSLTLKRGDKVYKAIGVGEVKLDDTNEDEDEDCG
jgi:hypothetical protein